MTLVDYAAPAGGPPFAFLPGLGAIEVVILLLFGGMAWGLVVVLARSNEFEEVVRRLPTRLPEDVVARRAEDALGELGRVRVDGRGGIRIEPRGGDVSPLTDVEMEGQLRRRGEGYEVLLRYACKPSAVGWVVAAVLLVTTCVGALLLLYLVPLSARQNLGKRVRESLDDLEDAFANES